MFLEVHRLDFLQFQRDFRSFSDKKRPFKITQPIITYTILSPEYRSVVAEDVSGAVFFADDAFGAGSSAFLF